MKTLNNGHSLENLVRRNVRELAPYSSARQEYTGEASLWLDANENPYGGGVNRYPDPLQKELREELAQLRGVAPESILLGNGSDEILDLLFRAFCRPGTDRVLYFTPTYGMYRVIAGINDVEAVAVPSGAGFQPDLSAAASLLGDSSLKLTLLCSPNNPTGNCISRPLLDEILCTAAGLVVLDEAYIDFAPGASMLPELARYPNLVVVQTFSKGWGLAGARLGVAYASPAIVGILNRIRFPYNINTLTQNLVREKLRNSGEVFARVEQLIEERRVLVRSLEQLPQVLQVYPSDANFLLVRFDCPGRAYQYLLEQGIVVRNVSGAVAGCLRITVGTPAENRLLVAAVAGL